MSRVPVLFWLFVGVAALFAYSVAHRRARTALMTAQEAAESSTPLQPFTQPQPAPTPYLSYGQVPFGQDAVTSTQPRYQFSYTSSSGAIA